MASELPKALMDGPSILPPAGVEADFMDPQNLAVVDYAVVGVCVFLSTLIVGLRMYSKKTVTKSCGADDVVLLAGWIAFMVFCVFIAVMAHDGIARHQWNVRLYEMENILLHLFIDSAIYCLVTALIKAAIFLQFLKIFNPSKTRGPMFWSCWGFLVFFSAFYLAVLIAGIFICTPIDKFWVLWMPGGHCAKRRSIPIISASANIAADVVIILLPQKTIWQLQMPLQRRLRVSLIFGVGLLALAASVARLHYTLLMVNSQDVTWNVNNMGLWTLVEIIITIACSSAPSLNALVKSWKPSISNFTGRLTGRSCLSRSLVKGSRGAGSYPGSTRDMQPLQSVPYYSRGMTEDTTWWAQKQTLAHGRQNSWLRDPPSVKYTSVRAYEVV